ncbi:MAG TPA: SDR family oxidoreductase [Paraburkholderia sp.]|jgi:nucleoside-diphosphate-sugar epimerase
MKIFVTGASGFIGSAVVERLLAGGHEVVGLVRSDEGAARAKAAGAQPRRGTIEDLPGLRQAAEQADGVVHTAYFHAFSHPGWGTRLRVMFGGMPTNVVGRFMTATVDADCRAIEAMGGPLREKAGPLVAAFPTMAMTPGHIALETALADPRSPGGVRSRSERTMLRLAELGVRASMVRLPPTVHDTTKLGLVSRLVDIARKKRVSAYVGDGKNRWPAVHRLDAAAVFVRALENGIAGARYHAVAEEAVPFRDIAHAIGQPLGIPVAGLTPQEAKGHFGWLASFVANDNPVSSDATQAGLCWRPGHSPLAADLADFIGARGR